MQVVGSLGVVAGVAVAGAGCDYFPEYIGASEEADGALGVHIAICDDELVESLTIYEASDYSEPVWRVEFEPPAQIRHFVAEEPLAHGMRRTFGPERFDIPANGFYLRARYSNLEYTESVYLSSGALRRGKINAEGKNIDPSEFDAWEGTVCAHSGDGGGVLPGWVGWLFPIGLGLITAVTAIVTNRRYAERARRAEAMRVGAGGGRPVAKDGGS